MLFAHQGGWDELLFVLVPLVLFAGLLVIARRRVEALDDHESGTDPATTGATTDEP